MREALGADPPGLLERLRAGEPRAFEELVTAYQHRVFGVALRMLGSRAEAEEIAQEVFLRAYRALADFRGDARPGTWLAATRRWPTSRLRRPTPRPRPSAPNWTRRCARPSPGCRRTGVSCWCSATSRGYRTKRSRRPSLSIQAPCARGCTA